MDKIILQGLRFMACHGALPHERQVMQLFLVDLELQLDLRPAGGSDRLEDTVDYGAVYETVRQVLTGSPYTLLEALAEACAQKILETYPVGQVMVRLTKPHAPIGGDMAAAAVEIIRHL
jgi:dihydroneopterin aldolase